MTGELSAIEGMERIRTLTAHLWMVRSVLKHAPEFEEDVDRMEIPRAIFDFVRAIEGRYLARDPAGYFKMVRKKFGKLRAACVRFSLEQPQISNHTSFQLAVVSFRACVEEIQAILDAVGGVAGAPAGGIDDTHSDS